MEMIYLAIEKHMSIGFEQERPIKIHASSDHLIFTKIFF